jgi:thiol-disulfide isomerase/thioredoxin
MRGLFALLLACVITTSSNASEIKFVKNKTWKQILELAKQQNKMIFFDAYASWCGPCKYMEESVYTSEDVAAYYNANFINVKLDMEVGEGVKLSEKFGIAAYPTLLFISPAGKLLHKAVGALDIDEFIQLGKEAKKPETQYYTLKEKVKNNTVSDEAFAKWAALAKGVYDNDLNSFIRAFFARKKDILLNEHTAKVAIKYADSLTDAQVFYLINNQTKISTLMKTDARGAWRLIYDKLFSMGSRAYNETKDEEEIKKVFHKYLPSDEVLAMNDLSIRMAIYIDEDTKAAAGLLTKYISEGSLNLQEAGEILFEIAEKFSTEDYGDIVKKLDQYKFTPGDKGREGYLYFMQSVCYVGMDEKEKGKPYAQKAVDDPSTPEEYKVMLRVLYGI